MSNFIGIDLGTSFSALAYVDDVGKPTIIRDTDGVNITASCVAHSADGSLVVGNAARTKAKAGKGAFSFKREMGTEKEITIDGKSFSPTDLSALVLKRLKENAKKKLGELDHVVVTIPANFSHEARQATLEAAEAAGLNVSTLINEPTAAALAYLDQLGQRESGIFAIFDLGGGTFDISIVQICEESVEILGSSGVSRLGGDNFDEKILEVVRTTYKQLSGNNLNPTDFNQEDAEEIKKGLSSQKLVEARVGRSEFIPIKREELEEAVSDLIAQIVMHCESALDDANLGQKRIDRLFLAGGSSRIPSVQAAAKKVFGIPPEITDNVDEVVALGAAIYGAKKAPVGSLNTAQKRRIGSANVQDIVTSNYGVLAYGERPEGGMPALENSVVLARGNKIPCASERSYYTVADGQENVEVVLTECHTDETDPEFVKVLGKENLSLPAGRPAGQKVDVIYSLDESGVLHCEYKDAESNASTEIRIGLRGTASMDRSEIEDLFEIE